MVKKIILFLIVVLAVGLIAFYFWGSASSGEIASRDYLTAYREYSNEKTDTLTIMTYNIGYLSGMTNNLAVSRSDSLFNANLRKGTELMRDAPDILAFQEIDIAAERSFNINQLEAIGMSLDYFQSYTSVNWDKRYVPFPYWPITYHFGKVISAQAILSMFPIVKNSTVTLRQPVNAPFYEKAFYIDRLVQQVVINIHGSDLMIMNVHLEAFDADTRNLQAEVVGELYKKYKDQMPVILLGDFNSQLATAGAENWKATEIILAQDNIEAAVSPAMYESEPTKYNTFSSASPFQMIDHIFFNPSHISKTEVKVGLEFTDISDHLPVQMKFLLTSQLKE